MFYVGGKKPTNPPLLFLCIFIMSSLLLLIGVMRITKRSLLNARRSVIGIRIRQCDRTLKLCGSSFQYIICARRLNYEKNDTDTITYIRPTFTTSTLIFCNYLPYELINIRDGTGSSGLILVLLCSFIRTRRFIGKNNE